MEDTLKHLVGSTTRLPSSPFTIAKLAGQASYREYFRLTFENGTTAILMKMPARASSVSEEITKSDKPISELPFINVQRYLKESGLPVPEVFGYSAGEGLLLLEDLGDRSLESLVQKANGEQTLFFYKKAVQLLADLQKKTQNNKTNHCVAFSRRFDETLLNWEFDHFLEYGLEDRLNIKLPPEDKSLFEKITRQMTQKIVEMPQGFAHRDFQSRNLHLAKYQFWMIDFQDALIGPLVYDLTALLRDSYVVLSRKNIQILLEEYTKEVGPLHPYYENLEKLKKDFDLITIQRKLKDAGRFQYIHTVKKNSDFLKSVAPSLKYVREALERHEEYAELLQLIAKYLHEFKI